MIRINLIPVRQVRKVQAGQRQLILFAGLIVVEIIAFVLLYNATAGEIDEKKKTISTLDAEIAALKREVGDYERLQSQRQVLINQRNVINQLNRSRIGPVWGLRELSALLSVTGRPTVDQAAYDELLRRNPSAGFNLKWNPRRVWIESFIERGKNVTMVGKAKDFDDVAEFLKRLNVSRFFSNVRLQTPKAVRDTKLGIRVIAFGVTARMKYHLQATKPPPKKPGQPGAPGAAAPTRNQNVQRGINRMTGRP